jgi:serine/threonine protein phosphatase PrpC
MLSLTIKSNLFKKSVIAVADGVGGWAEQGIDPALYSKELCRMLFT